MLQNSDCNCEFLILKCYDGGVVHLFYFQMFVLVTLTLSVCVTNAISGNILRADVRKGACCHLVFVYLSACLSFETAEVVLSTK